MTDIQVRAEGAARVNWSRWIIDCAHCQSGLTPGCHLYDEHGVMIRYSIEWGDTSMLCWDCGRITEGILWPADPAAIWAILSMRPDERTRNWYPNETLDALMLENIAHGILPPDEILAAGGPLILGVGDRVTGGMVDVMAGKIDPARRVHEIGS
jgi:hypothetical protein